MTPASAQPPPDPQRVGTNLPDGMEPEAVMASVQSLLALWAAEDSQRLEALARARLLPAGSRSGRGAASLLPYLINLLIRH